jgi:hypothetical protein
MIREYRYSLLPTLAQRIPSYLGQISLLESNCFSSVAERENTIIGLAENKNLDDKVWYKLAKKPKAKVAYGLLSRNLDIDKLIAFSGDKRVTINTCILQNGLKNCSVEVAKYILQQPFLDKNSARIWAKYGLVPNEVRKELGMIENGSFLLTCMQNENDFPLEEILELLPNIFYNRVRFNLYALFDRRPDLVDSYKNNIIPNRRVLDALAGSRHIFDESFFQKIYDQATLDTVESVERDDIFFSLLANPNTPLEIIDNVLKKINLSRINYLNRHRFADNHTIINHGADKLKRKITNPIYAWDNYLPIPTSPYRIASSLLGFSRYPSMKSKNLVKESNTESNITMHIVPEEIKLDNTIRTTNFNRETIKYFSDLLDNAGVESWELFWVLLETWEGDFKSLLELTTNMK